MPKFGSKKKFTDYFYSKGVVVILGVIIVYMGMSVYERYTVERQMAERRIDAEKELQELTERKNELGERVRYLEGERGIEEEIRKNFDVAREGEQVVILLGDDEDDEPPEESVEVQKKWYQFWR